MRLMRLLAPLLCAALLSVAPPAAATDETPISLADKAITLTPSPAFQYVAGADTQDFLSRHWQGRPLAGGAGLGLLVPVGSAPDPAWLVALSYDGSGHVSDLDAGRLDADALLSALKSADSGGPRLTGWAQPPVYDSASHTLIWATRRQADGGAVDGLDYHARLLGRRGVLGLDIAARMSDLPAIEGQMPALLSMVRFTPGNGYRDYVPVADQSVTLGLSGLVAGDALVKGGLLDHLWNGIRSQNFIYLVAVLIMMLGAPRLRRYWGPKPPPTRDQEPPVPPPPPKREDHAGPKGPWS
ncbi:DUF2167 domain-containing protein [Nitrospirillum viridazoti]|uniref:Membrane-anchored protein n=1 Tax=Nitrospirillum viridazoti CBAmc TaxID=1441467 RepID=A0A248JRM2_9PROT|nr:DUF2167 domain-containing protein [Nitrospirillum amazonense]ASG21259.1 hypothetical protein Y958_10800 [Nitrospirillum amazonense CBAmc]TWB32257.1 putative membrane-anchored protein [Nitrospirillum amazonense]